MQKSALHEMLAGKNVSKSWDGDRGVTLASQNGPILPFVIGVAGGTASGKTSVCQMISNELKDQRVAVISLDSFYNPLSEEKRRNVSEYNFDHPDAFDFNLSIETLKCLREGKRTDIPVYDFVTHSRLRDEVVSIISADVVLFEGILVFYSKELLEMMDMKLFVDVDADTRLARRIIRDINVRGRDVMGVLRQYEKFVKPAFEDYVLPTKKYADVIIPRGADNNVAINLIVQHLKGKLEERRLQRQSLWSSKRFN